MIPPPPLIVISGVFASLVLCIAVWAVGWAAVEIGRRL